MDLTDYRILRRLLVASLQNLEGLRDATPDTFNSDDADRIVRARCDVRTALDLTSNHHYERRAEDDHDEDLLPGERDMPPGPNVDALRALEAGGRARSRREEPDRTRRTPAELANDAAIEREWDKRAGR